MKTDIDNNDTGQVDKIDGIDTRDVKTGVD